MHCSPPLTSGEVGTVCTAPSTLGTALYALDEKDRLAGLTSAFRTPPLTKQRSFLGRELAGSCMLCKRAQILREDKAPLRLLR
jgi:hypothetical protein